MLLKNEKNLLPLDLTKLKTIAVIGPNAADVHLGGYSREPGHSASACCDGIRAYVGDKAKVLYAAGLQDYDCARRACRGWWAERRGTRRSAGHRSKIHQGSWRGGAEGRCGHSWWLGKTRAPTARPGSETHRGDRDSLDLLGAQNDLVKAVVETGKPVVVLLINGRPLSINYIAEHVPAILEGWYLGAGRRQPPPADVIFGDVNPGGKLPITFPHSVGDLPDFYNHKPSGQSHLRLQHAQAAVSLRLRAELHDVQV